MAAVQTAGAIDFIRVKGGLFQSQHAVDRCFSGFDGAFGFVNAIDIQQGDFYLPFERDIPLTLI